MAIDLNSLYDPQKVAQMQALDRLKSNREGLNDQFAPKSFDARNQIAGALDNPNNPNSLGAAGLQDAMGTSSTDAAKSLDAVTAQRATGQAAMDSGAPPPGMQMRGMGSPPPSQQQLTAAQGLSASDRPVPTPQAPPPMGGQPSRLPQMNPPSSAGPGGAPGPLPTGAPPLAPSPQQMAPQPGSTSLAPGLSGVAPAAPGASLGAPPPQMQQTPPSVAPPQAPGPMSGPGGPPPMQGANGATPPGPPPQAIAAIQNASPQQMKQAMSQMQQMWEQAQMQKRMAMGRGQ